MTRRRSAFGELLRFHRRRLGLTQDQLAAQVQWRVTQAFHSGAPRGRETFSQRTISNHERMWDDPRDFKRPQLSTVHLLAEVLKLVPGSPEFAAFLHAAEFVTEEPVAAPQATHSPASAMVPPRVFVPEGRESHLRQLREMVARAAGGLPQVALVRADPGTGKSWMIGEICREAVASYRDLVVAWGECVDRFGMADPYHPIRQVLDIVTGGVHLASTRQLVASSNRERLLARTPLTIATLVDHGPELIDRFISTQTLAARAAEFHVDPAIRQALAARDRASLAEASELGEAFARVLIAMAGSGPVHILVIEDVHWADAGTCAVLAQLARVVRRHRVPVLLICSYRSTDLATGDLLHTHPFHTLRRQVLGWYPDAEIDLDTAVGGEAGQAFVDGYFARHQMRPSAALRASLIAQTGGMPLFVDSLLRYFRRKGMVSDGSGGELELVGELGPRDLPMEIGAIFAEQMERIASDLQRMLALASVQRGPIVAEVVVHALHLPPTAVTAILDAQLVERHDVLRPTGTAIIAGHAVHRYRFKHALLRNFLLRRTGEFRQTQYHMATADAFREIYGAGPHEGSATMAWHYVEAGEKVRAAEAEVAAGEFAMNRGDDDLARHHFRRVIELRIEREAPHLVAQARQGSAACDRAQGMAADVADYGGTDGAA